MQVLNHMWRQYATARVGPQQLSTKRSTPAVGFSRADRDSSKKVPCPAPPRRTAPAPKRCNPTPPPPPPLLCHPALHDAERTSNGVIKRLSDLRRAERRRALARLA